MLSHKTRRFLVWLGFWFLALVLVSGFGLHWLAWSGPRWVMIHLCDDFSILLDLLFSCIPYVVLRYAAGLLVDGWLGLMSWYNSYESWLWQWQWQWQWLMEWIKVWRFTGNIIMTIKMDTHKIRMIHAWTEIKASSSIMQLLTTKRKIVENKWRASSSNPEHLYMTPE